jgi:hypothetical protein
MPTYVSIPSESIKSALRAMGMVEKATPPSRYSPGEVYFEMPTTVNPQLVIKVYTSIPVGGGNVRGRGQDAIRVCLVWRSDEREIQSAGLVKTIRVHRVTSVASTLKRLKDRVRDCNRKAVELNERKCSVCGCPVWPESGRCRNRKCGRPAPSRQAPAPAPAPRAAGASARLNSAFGASHSPMTQAVAARAHKPATVAPVAPSTATRRIAKEADRNVAEEPVLTNADMPPELRGLF